MGQRIAVQKQQWWPITAMAQANLRAAGRDIGQRKAGHDFHGLFPCRFAGQFVYSLLWRINDFVASLAVTE
jgi:hypothetical protein